MGDVYEDIPDSTLPIQMMAGAMAGFMEHGIMYPVDCVKTRMQCLRPPPEATYTSVMDGLYKLIRHEGFRRSFRGISAVVFGAGPAHALYFGCYEQMKAMLSKYSSHASIAQGVAGSCATMLHDAIMTPADVVKQRIQMYDSAYNGCRDCVHRVVREEGIRALYRSYTTQLLMNVPFGATYFITYETTQDVLNPERNYRPLTHVISGAVSGGFAAGITTPLDVCKTVLNTQTSVQGQPACKLSATRFCDPYATLRTNDAPSQPTCGRSGVDTRPSDAPATAKHAVSVTHSEHSAPGSSRGAHTATSTSMASSKLTARSTRTQAHVVGIRQACSSIYSSYGLAGFFRGAQARVLQQMPATAISWSVYEFFKWQLSKKAGESISAPSRSEVRPSDVHSDQHAR